jgi:CNT family concentrative nucleoside transporter
VVTKELSWFSRNRGLVRRLRLFALAALILGWWISATILRATRHRWIVQTVFAWSFVAIIAFRFIPNSVVTRPVAAVWLPWVQEPFFALSRYVRYGLGWLALLAITLGSAFGFELENVDDFTQLSLAFDFPCLPPPFVHSLIRVFTNQGTNYGDRAISVLGLIVFQFGFWATSKHRSHIHWRTVIVGLFLQQAIALFVLKSGAGFNLFRWLADLASDFLAQGLVGAAFFFDQDTVNTKHWFFVNVVRYFPRK